MNIGKAGIIMITYLFIIFTAWMFLSSPFENIIGSFEGLNNEAGDELDDQISRSRNVFNIFFGGMAVVPIIWFFIWIMRREPDWGYR